MWTGLKTLSPGMGSIPSRCFFSYHSFSFLPFLQLFLFLPSFFCPPLISSFPPPHPPTRLPSFFLSTILFPFVFFLFYFLLPHFCCFSLSFLPLFYSPDFFRLFLSSLRLILFVFFFLALKLVSCSTCLPRGLL